MPLSTIWRSSAGATKAFDERIREHLATHVISIGDFILTRRRTARADALDAVARLKPGVLGDNDHQRRFLLQWTIGYPQYTRPPEFRGWTVPDVLQQGNHAQQTRWKREQSLIRTLLWRPDLLLKADLTDKDRKFLEEYVAQKLAKQLGDSDTD